MTVEITLLPDGQSQIPAELRDDDIMSSYFDKLNVTQKTPIESWGDVRILRHGDMGNLTIRIEGIMLSDVPDTLLDEVQQTIVQPTNGVKPHQNGWVEYDESDDNLPANQ